MNTIQKAKSIEFRVGSLISHMLVGRARVATGVENRAPVGRSLPRK